MKAAQMKPQKTCGEAFGYTVERLQRHAAELNAIQSGYMMKTLAQGLGLWGAEISRRLPEVIYVQ